MYIFKMAAILILFNGLYNINFQDIFSLLINEYMRMLDNLQHQSCRYYKYQASYNSKWPPYFIQDGRHNWHCYAKFAIF